MSILTLFSAPKPFTDPRIATIQWNAIRSWTRLADVDILLMGDESGVAEVARGTGSKHLRDVQRNENGTPLVSSMIHLAREYSSSELLCIINADIIAMKDLVEATRQVSRLRHDFVFLGRRWDMEITSEMDFVNGWQERLRADLNNYGVLHRPAGSDYFVFPRHCYETVPDFAVGRAGWDNWMISEARRNKWPVIDGTPTVTIVHQNHDYSHLPGGIPHYATPESNENIRLAGGEASIRYTILDATLCLKNGKLVQPGMSYPRFMRFVELFLRRIFFLLPANMIEEVARPKRWKKRLSRIMGRKLGQ